MQVSKVFRNRYVLCGALGEKWFPQSKDLRIDADEKTIDTSSGI